MDELRRVRDTVRPHEILLVVDAMTGQEAVNVARGFNEALQVNGFILTKLDGDTRGGAALSIKSVAGKPIKFIGVGEKMDALEIFHPDRMASRILGMGDVLSLIERAEAAYDKKEAEDLEKKLKANRFDFDDFLNQMRQIRKLGPLENLLGLLPGMGSAMKDVQIDPKALGRTEAMICSMTKQERREPSIINGSRRRRIAAGSGTTVQEVNQLLAMFEQFKKMMRGMSGGPGSAPPMAGFPASARGKHAGSNKQNKRKPPPAIKLRFGRR
jgi:signal recognition particle subunit SRP54